MARHQMGQTGVRAVKMAMPLLSNDAEFFPGRRLPRRGGLANSYYWIDPKEAIGGVYLIQGAPVRGQEVLAAVLRVRAEV
jgi:hypothetical protein